MSKDRFGGLYAMINFLGIDETPHALERSFKAATKLRSELPTNIEMESIPFIEISSLTQVAEDVNVKTGEASQNANLDMREF